MMIHTIFATGFFLAIQPVSAVFLQGRPIASAGGIDFCTSSTRTYGECLSMAEKRLFYSSQQLLSINSPMCKFPLLSPDNFQCLNDNGILRNSVKTKRGKRGGVRRLIKVQITERGTSNKSCKQTGVNFNNLKPLNKASASKHIEFCLINARSVRNKATIISDYIIERDLDVAVIVESWLSDGDEGVISELVPDGYSYYLENRKHGSGGGIIVVYKSNLQLKKNSTPTFKSFELLEAELKYNGEACVLSAIYRPPASKRNALTCDMFLDEFETYLVDASSKPGNLVLIGDFNIHVDNQSDPFATKFMTIINAMNFTQRVKHPTHEAGHILDLILVHKDNSLIDCVSVGSNFFSDHSCVHFNMSVEKNPRVSKHISYRKTASIDIDIIKSAIVDAKLNARVSEQTSVTEQVEVFNTILSDILEQHAPLQHRKVTIRPKSQWFNDKIRDAKHKRRKAERKWRHTKLTVHKQIYETAKHETNSVIKKSKRAYLKDKLFNSKGNTKELYKLVGGLMGRGSTGQCLPSSTDSKHLADTFSTFFKDKVDNISKSFETINNTQDCQHPKPLPNTLSDLPLTNTKEVIELIKHMPNKTCSLDCVPTWLIKRCVVELAPAIVTIINTSLSSGEIPPLFKEAVVTPLLKKPSLDNEVLKNYRPVSNLNFLSKLLEKVVARRLRSHIGKSNLNTTFQSAYKENHSTESALLRIHNDILRSIDNNQCVLLVLLDLSAAFDTIDQTLLLERLQHNYGVADSALKWFTEYLIGRSQKVKIQDTLSSPSDLKCGVPQGSVLGPILFSLYTGPLSEILGNME